MRGALVLLALALARTATADPVRGTDELAASGTLIAGGSAHAIVVRESLDWRNQHGDVSFTTLVADQVMDGMTTSQAEADVRAKLARMWAFERQLARLFAGRSFTPEHPIAFDDARGLDVGDGARLERLVATATATAGRFRVYAIVSLDASGLRGQATIAGTIELAHDALTAADVIAAMDATGLATISFGATAHLRRSY
ncbi:MAG TPA: hypothetical protein VL463_02600 [Kofleriaceae bacterium]|jgi:hypothetical protein|nr:hypothetical protein [Kofleriaceae bacterium]